MQSKPEAWTSRREPGNHDGIESVQPRPIEEAGDEKRPQVSVVVPVFNEAAILRQSLESLIRFLEAAPFEGDWEVIVVNDGSTDESGEIAREFAQNHDKVFVLHHRRNFGVGQALRYAFRFSRGYYVVTLDADLTYSPDHITRILESMDSTGARIVATSPYMKGGRTTAIPRFRRVLSVCANRFLSLASRGKLSTVTSMVRGYDGQFIRGIDLQSTGMEINAEIVYKALLLGIRIEEIPAHLDWSKFQSGSTNRSSSVRIFRQTMSILLSGFLFRPVIFFILPGMLLILFAIYPTAWMFAHFFHYFFGEFASLAWLPSRASQSVAAAFELAPHTFFIAGIAWMLGIQLVSLGILALQSKSYFEEIYHLGSTTLRTVRDSRRDP